MDELRINEYVLSSDNDSDNEQINANPPDQVASDSEDEQMIANPQDQIADDPEGAQAIAILRDQIVSDSDDEEQMDDNIRELQEQFIHNDFEDEERVNAAERAQIDNEIMNILDDAVNRLDIEMLTDDSEDEVDVDHGRMLNNDSDSDDDIEINFNEMTDTFSINAEAEGLNAPLVARGNMRGVDNLILIIANCLRYKESYKSMISKFRIFNLNFNNAHLPLDMKDFWKIVNRRITDFTNITVCSKCWQVLGRGKTPTIVCRCGKCGPREENSALGTYLYMNLKHQIRGVLNKPGMFRDLQYPYTRRKRNIDAIEDVYDGEEYRRLSAMGNFLYRHNNNYSLAIWTDGVSPVKSSNVSIWPVFVQLLELSPRARQRNSMLAAVYVGPRKPLMVQFLAPVALQLRNLKEDGVSWRPNPNEEITSRFLTLIVSADSEGRYAVYGMTRHNGAFGCTFCYANGEKINRQAPFYRHDDGNAADRTHDEIMQAYLDLHNTGERQRGIKCYSALTVIPQLDLRVSQLVEAMHCLWEGNFARLYNNLINPHTANHILPRNIAIISNRIMSIKPPTKLSRKPRDLERFANFTATEHRNLAWYYWLPCAQDFLSRNHLRLCAIFAEATFILNKDSILRHELDRAERLLDEYRRLFELTFPREQLTYNVHLLKHITRCVRDLGPSWVASGFWFESLNRQLVNFLTSPTDRAWQVACRILMSQMVEKFLDWNLREEVENELRKLIGKEKWNERPNIATGRFIRPDDVGIDRMFRADEIAALREAGFVNVDPQIAITAHKKVTIDGVKYQTPGDRVVKYNNSLVYVNAQYRGQQVEFANINAIVTWNIENEIMRGIFGTIFNVIGPAFETSYMKIVEQSQNLVYVPMRDVITPAVLVQSCGRTYISRLPNRWDND